MFRFVCLFAVLLSPMLIAQDKSDEDVQTFNSGNIRVSLAVKGKPTSESTKDVAYGPESSQTVKVTIRKWETKNSGSYSLMFAEYPNVIAKADAKTILNGVRDGLRGPETLGGIIDVDKEITLGKAKLLGREVKIHAKKNYISARLIYIEPRLIQVMVTGSDAQLESDTAKKFLSSIQIEVRSEDDK